MKEESPCKKQWDGIDPLYVEPIINNLNSHFNSEITLAKINDVIESFIKEQLLDGNKFKNMLNKSILSSISDIQISGTKYLLQTILENNHFFQGYIFDFVNAKEVKGQNFLNVFLENIKNKKTDDNNDKIVYDKFKQFLSNLLKANNAISKNEETNMEEEGNDTEAETKNVGEKKESGDTKPFNCIYNGCDDTKMRDLYIHLIKAATTVKYKGRLADKILKVTKEIIDKNKNDIKTMIRNAVNSLNFDNDETTINSILNLIITDSDIYKRNLFFFKNTQTRNKKLMMDLLRKMIPKMAELKEKPKVGNKPMKNQPNKNEYIPPPIPPAVPYPNAGGNKKRTIKNRKNQFTQKRHKMNHVKINRNRNRITKKHE